MANHASTRTTQLYDRRRDELSLDEVEPLVLSDLTYATKTMGSCIKFVAEVLNYATQAEHYADAVMWGAGYSRGRLERRGEAAQLWRAIPEQCCRAWADGPRIFEM